MSPFRAAAREGAVIASLRWPSVSFHATAGSLLCATQSGESMKKRAPPSGRNAQAGAKVRAIQSPVEHDSGRRAKIVDAARKRAASNAAPVPWRAPNFHGKPLVRLDAEMRGRQAPQARPKYLADTRSLPRERERCREARKNKGWRAREHLSREQVP